MARYTAVLLVIVLGAASARMLICESSCANETRVAVPEACHDQTRGEAPLTKLTNAHSCDHGGVVFTLTSNKVTFERIAPSISVPSSTSTPLGAHSFEHLAHSPPGSTHDPRPQTVVNLRI